MIKIKAITCSRDIRKGFDDRDFLDLEKSLEAGWEIIGQKDFTFILKYDSDPYKK